MASYKRPAAQHGWDSDSESELSDSPSLEEFADTERTLQLPGVPSTPKRSVRAKNLPPRKRPRLQRGTYKQSDSSPSPTRAGRKRKQSRPTKSNKPQKEDLESDDEEDNSDDEPTPPPRFNPGANPNERMAFEKESLQGEHLAPVQRLPGEILGPIAIHVQSDVDLANLRLADRTFTDTVSPTNITVWRKRFLSRWDAAFITKAYQYGPAYMERSFIIAHCISFSNGNDERVKLHLRVFQEMTLETFHPVEAHLPPPVASLNLVVFTAPGDWMHSLLSAPFYDHGRGTYGKPEPLFDALQLTFSFLMLSTKYPVAKVVTFARSDYNIAKVYNWNKPFKTLFNRLPAPKPYSAFPNLPRVSTVDFSLNTNDLLHIRNFFHRHLIHDAMGTNYLSEIPEDTFYRSTNKLTELGHIAKPWTAPLQNFDANLEGILRGTWVGFYSNVGAWPEKERDLVELQSDATDWTAVDPLTLRFSVSTSNKQGGAAIWPDTFANIPCFATTVPTSPQETLQLRNSGLGSTYFLRGMAPFMDIDNVVLARHHGADRDDSGAAPLANNADGTASRPELDNHHPFNALRLRGVIHPLPAEFDHSASSDEKSTAAPVPMALKPALPIPGFRRLVLILYKPTVNDLLKQLEYADESFGSTFGVAVTAQMDQATTLAIQTVLNGGGDLPEEAMEHLRSYLAGLIQQREADGETQGDDSKGKWTKEELIALEHGFHKDGQIDWTDVEYAYAYEGIVTPGGNVMMGRWWRVGMAGEGISEGCEMDSLGVGVPTEGGEGKKALERGPFVFWPMANDGR